MAEIIEEDEKSKNTFKSKLSLDSVEEISSRTRSLLSLSLIIINLISIIIGIFILYNNNYYLNPDFKFSNQISLFIFIIIYTFGILFALIMSFLFSLIMKIIYYYKNSNNPIINNNDNDNNNNNNNNLVDNEKKLGRISIFILNNQRNEIALIPFTLSYFIIFIICIYFIAFPYAIILMIKLLQNNFLRKVFSFILLYLFILINLLAGLIMDLALFYIVFVKKRGNIRKQEFNIDNSNIENIRNEIRIAMNN